jgi:hypothetical protein
MLITKVGCTLQGVSPLRGGAAPTPPVLTDLSTAIYLSEILPIQKDDQSNSKPIVFLSINS